MIGAKMTITTNTAPDGTVELVAVGELDLSTIGRFRDALLAAIAAAGPGRTTAVDLRGVEYLDSAAINALFAHADRISRIRVQPLLMRGLSISGLDKIVEVQTAP